MTFLKKLKAHKGGLVRLKTDLCWYGPGWDGCYGRICLLLDTSKSDLQNVAASSAVDATHGSSALLLVDGQPLWVWIGEKDVELL